VRVPRPRSRLGRAGVLAGAVLGALVVFFLIAPYNIAARVPHLPGVAWLLHTYMENSVRTWSRGTDQPKWVDLDDPALVRLGAGHFENGCAPCHGAPGRPPNPLTRGMRPTPPPLAGPAEDYDARELHWIVWNGLKFTGMPAWSGEGRDDEPWALAAFLKRYPELDASAYADLALEPDASRYLTVAQSEGLTELSDRIGSLTGECARCHGADGLGRDGTAPKLAGQSREYIEATLSAFADERRPSGIMGPIAATLSTVEIERLAAHYADLPWSGRVEVGGTLSNLASAGAEIAARGTAEIPSCLSCHGDDLSPPRNPAYPRLSGQEERFLTIWLRLWRDRPFGGTDYAHVMHEAARWLSDRDISALAAYFSSSEVSRPP